MADIGLSAFSLFFMQSESFLSYQRSLEEGRKTSNCHTLFGMAKIPTDNHIRSMLDPVHPSHLQSSFDRRAGRHERFRAPWRTRADRARWNRIFLLAKARLSAVPNPQAFERQDRILPFDAGGDTRRARPQHGRAADARVHRQAGRRAEKQDCERNAAKRWNRIRGRIETIIAKNVDIDDNARNPAELTKQLREKLPRRPKRKPRHHPALPYAETPQFMPELAGADGRAARHSAF